jgi:hypothetical protein
VGAALDLLEQGEGMEEGFNRHEISKKLEHIMQTTPVNIIFISLYS